jgi:hypothetical protein
MTPMRLPATVLLVLVALLAAGCGGGSKTLTHDEFVTKADDVCRDSQAEIRKLQPPTNNQEAAAYFTREYDIQEASLAKLRKLEPPPKDAKKVKELVGHFHKVDLAVKEAASALGRQNKKDFDAARGHAAVAITRASAAAGDLGLKVCGKLASS